MKRQIGGDRIGSGDKMSVDMKTYNRSTHNLNKPWRSTMSAGTIVPFYKRLILPGDTIDLELEVDVMTHPTTGPLFGKYKIELFIFEGPTRLYQALLHNNALNIGMKMNTVKKPLIRLYAEGLPAEGNIDNSQINPSCLLAYLGIRGVGYVKEEVEGRIERMFGAEPFLLYWDTIKNYYTNKQEEVGYVIHTEREALIETITSIVRGATTIVQSPSVGSVTINTTLPITVNFTGTRPKEKQIILNTDKGDFTIQEIFNTTFEDSDQLVCYYTGTKGFEITIINWRYVNNNESVVNKIELSEYPIENIDKMRNALLNNAAETSAKIINDLGIGEPYSLLLDWMEGNTLSPYISTQEGLAVKTYNSDKFNNWMSTEWIEGPGGISEITAIDTSGGSFTIDTLVLARKVYNMLNRIALSGGTYKDWIDTVYTDQGNWMCSTPIFHGGLIREIVFQEVISNSESNSGQPLGTIAGRGIMGQKRKGGNVTIKVTEPGYLIGLASITPIVDYSQGNDWDIHIKSMDELHAPEMDAIGFQDLITEELAWWDTEWDEVNEKWIQKSAGKQPAWINYMTDTPRTYGNFAIENNEMFMTLNRRYERENGQIKDLTTYIDPSKYNFIFAQTSLDSQNFWVQIGIRDTERRLMSAKVMPNL